MHRRAVAKGDHQTVVGGSVLQLALRLNRVTAHAAVERTGGEIGVAALDRLLYLCQRQVARRQRVRIHEQANRIFVGTEHQYLRHAWDGRYLLGNTGLCVFVELGERQLIGGQCQIDDRKVGRIDLA